MFSQRLNARVTRTQKFAVEGLGQLGALKEQITARLEREFAESISPRFVRLIVNEATALAATTTFPTLLLPALAEEKVRKASAWASRQQALRNQALTLAA